MVMISFIFSYSLIFYAILSEILMSHSMMKSHLYFSFFLQLFFIFFCSFSFIFLYVFFYLPYQIIKELYKAYLFQFVNLNYKYLNKLIQVNIEYIYRHDHFFKITLLNKALNNFIFLKKSQNMTKIVDNYQIDQSTLIFEDSVEIYSAKHTTTHQSFTIKKLNLKNNLNSDHYSSLLNQVSLLKELSCVRIMKCHKMLKTSNNIYLVFEYNPPNTLFNFIKGSIKKVPSIKKQQIVLQICEALKHMKSKGVVHLNLNPKCIYIDESMNVKLGGFLYGEVIKNDNDSIINIPIPQSEFAAPEVLLKRTCNYSSDVYSLGKIMYALELSNQQSNLLNIGPVLSRETQLTCLMKKMISKNPVHRIQIEQLYQYLSKRQSRIRKSPNKKEEQTQNTKKYTGKFLTHKNLSLNVTPKQFFTNTNDGSGSNRANSRGSNRGSSRGSGKGSNTNIPLNLDPQKSNRIPTKPQNNLMKSPVLDKKISMQKNIQKTNIKNVSNVTNQTKIEQSLKTLISSKNSDAVVEQIKQKKLSKQQKMQLKKCILSILKKRNLSIFLLQLSKICLNLPINEISTILSFLLLKKSTVNIKQLNKPSPTNKDPTSKYFNSQQYVQFASFLDKQFNFQYKELKNIQNQIRCSKNQQLLMNTRFIEQLNNETTIDQKFLKEMVSAYLKLMETKDQLKKLNSQTLIYLSLMSEVLSFNTYDKLFEELISEKNIDFESQPLVQHLKKQTATETIKGIQKKLKRN